jgi:hypothetical protein
MKIIATIPAENFKQSLNFFSPASKQGCAPFVCRAQKKKGLGCKPSPAM